MQGKAHGRVPIVDRDGRHFGEVDFAAGDHFEVVLNGRDIVRVERAQFEGAGEAGTLRLRVGGDQVFAGKRVTTIDGIDLGRVVEVVHAEGGDFEALIVGERGEAAPLAVPLAFVREVSAHIILEPSAEDVDGAQRRAGRSARVKAALRRARGGA